jgi:hypothetical protein
LTPFEQLDDALLPYYGYDLFNQVDQAKTSVTSEEKSKTFGADMTDFERAVA